MLTDTPGDQPESSVERRSQPEPGAPASEPPAAADTDPAFDRAYAELADIYPELSSTEARVVFAPLVRELSQLMARARIDRGIEHQSPSDENTARRVESDKQVRYAEISLKARVLQDRIHFARVTEERRRKSFASMVHVAGRLSSVLLDKMISGLVRTVFKA